MQLSFPLKNNRTRPSNGTHGFSRVWWKEKIPRKKNTMAREKNILAGGIWTLESQICLQIVSWYLPHSLLMLSHPSFIFSWISTECLLCAKHCVGLAPGAPCLSVVLTLSLLHGADSIVGSVGKTVTNLCPNQATHVLMCKVPCSVHSSHRC